DLDIDYRAATQESASCVAASPGFWCPLALTQDGNTLDATFGPVSGFLLTDGAVSMFRTRYHRGGRYDVGVSIAGVSTGTVYANASQSIDVAQLTLQSAGPASASTGANVDISATLANTGTAAISSATAAPNDENVLGQFVIALAGNTLAPSDLTVSYLAPDNAYHAITLNACASDATMLCGDFGPSTGFPVAAGYNATSLFRAVFNRNGAYAITTRAVGVTSGAMFATSSSALSIAMSNATIAFDPASLTQTYNGATHPVIVTTTPAGLSYTLTYDGSTTPPINAGDYAVVATITQAGYSGTASDVLHVVRATSSIDFGATNFTFDGQAHSTTAVLSQEPGNTTACTLTATSGPYPRTHAGSTTLTAACTGTNYVANGSTTLVVSPKAVTIALSGLGTFPYDGNPHAATATVSGDVAGFLATVDVTYNPGGSSAPVQIGSYGVVATLDVASSQDYSAAAANGTITIGTGTAVSIAANGAVTFSGTAGQLLPGAQPSVIVTDAGGHPVAGVAVTFAAGAGNGTLVAANQTTDANGIATLGGWILDPTPGTNTVTASAVGLTGSPVTFTADGAAAASALHVTITDYRDYVQFGHSLTYVITVGNNGSSNMTGVAVSDVLPVELTVGVNAWQCMAINGATCNTVTTRDLSGTIDLPAHSSVTYLLNALVNDTGSDLLSNTITATGPAGPVSATDTTEIVIFRNGFEVGGDGAQAVAPVTDGTAAPSLTTNQPVTLDIVSSTLLSLHITPIAQATGGAFRVEAIRIGNQVWLRLVARNGAVDAASAWSALSDAGARLALSSDGKQVILVGTASDLDVALAQAGPFTIERANH
ncbi:MAG: MBG domain-containing protein, partial [Dokdonella sp.]